MKTIVGSILSLLHRLLALAPLFAAVCLSALPAARAQDTGTLTTFYNFPRDTGDGSRLVGLIQGNDGNFYGTTASVLGNKPNGTVFRITPAGVVKTLYRFTNGSDGGRPGAGLVQGSDGNFYGTTTQGGDSIYGTVFRITPAGVFTRLYSFNSTDGFGSTSAMIQGLDGNFYGTTPGTVFRITPAGVFTTLHSFNSSMDGGSPAGLVQGSDGDFYGTTAYGPYQGGGGTAFRLSPTGEFTTLHSFGGDEGISPTGTLVQGNDGNFYGTTSERSSYYATALGSVFRLTPAGALTILHRFTGQDGNFVRAGLVQGSDGNLYGVTYYGGPAYQPNGPGGWGTLYQITPAGQLTTLYNFSSGVDGGLPLGGLFQGRDGNFYGVTIFGGGAQSGTIYELAVNPPPAFFDGATPLGGGMYYLAFPGGNYFGYYSYLADAHYIYHQDLGFEYMLDANDGLGGVYLYDFASGDFFYTSSQLSFPYLYDFTAESFLYYFPDPIHAGRYNTNGTRYFFAFKTGQVIVK